MEVYLPVVLPCWYIYPSSPKHDSPKMPKLLPLGPPQDWGSYETTKRSQLASGVSLYIAARHACQHSGILALAGRIAAEPGSWISSLFCQPPAGDSNTDPNSDKEWFTEVLDLLLTKGLDINAVDNKGWTALHYLANSWDPVSRRSGKLAELWGVGKRPGNHR